MGHKKNKMLLLILSMSLVLFEPAEAVCKPKNSAGKLAPGANDHATSSSSSSTSKATPSHEKEKSLSSTSSPPPKAASPPPKSPPPPMASPPPPAPVFSPPPPVATTPADDDDDHDSSSSKANPMHEDDSPSAQGGLLLPGLASLKLKLVCSQITSYPDLCMTTFSSFLNSNANLEDRMSLFNTAVQIVIKETDTLKELANSYMAKASSPTMVTNLKACLGDFDDALEDIQTAMKAVPSKDYGTLTTFLSTAIDDYSSCDDEFRGLNPLKTQTERLRHLVDNSLAFAQAVQWV